MAHRAAPTAWTWAGLWQFITLEVQDDSSAAKVLGERFHGAVGTLTELGVVRHALTHRRYEFTAYRANVSRDLISAHSRAETNRIEWVTLEKLDAFPMSKPQLEIARMLNAR